MSKIIDKLMAPRRSTRDLSFTILGTLVLALLFTLINPNFINKYNLVSLGQNLAPYAILALGALIPISMGGTDLSVGAVCIGSAVVAGKLYEMGMPFPLVIPVMMAFGALIGTVNGFLIAKKNLQPFIVTLGTMMFSRGATALFAGEATVIYPSGSWYNYVFSTYNGIPMSFFWIILITAVIFFVYRKTKAGRYFISIGSSEKATRISGVDVDKYTIIGYMASGLLAGIAAIFWSASFATVTVATGNGMELDAIGSVYIGGTSTAGGLANVIGAVVGSIMLVVIRSGLNFSLAKLNIDVNTTYVTFVISGIIVVTAVLLERSKRMPSKKRKVNLKKQAIVRLASYIVSIVLAIALVLISISSALGIGLFKNGASSAEGKKTICIALKSEGSDFWNTYSDGAKAAGEEFGYEVICRGTEDEDASRLPEQRQIVTTLLSRNPVGMGIATIAEGFTDLIEQAYDRGIKMVQYDSGLYEKDYEYIKNSSKNPFVSYIVASDYNNAQYAAEMTFPQIRDDIIKSDNYVIGIIQPALTRCAKDRAEGFRDRILELTEADPETKGKCTVYIEAKPSSVNNAFKEALELLFEKKANLIYAANLYAVNQCADAVEAAGGKYDGIKFVGYDTGDKISKWLKSDSKSPLIGTISQNPYLIGYNTVKALVDVAEGREVDEEIYIPCEWVTAANIDSVK